MNTDHASSPMQAGSTSHDDSATLRFSRACYICYADSPFHRSVSAACGHIFCRACALEMEHAAEDEGRCPKCPICRQESRFVHFQEMLIGDWKGLETEYNEKRQLWASWKDAAEKEMDELFRQVEPAVLEMVDEREATKEARDAARAGKTAAAAAAERAFSESMHLALNPSSDADSRLAAENLVKTCLAAVAAAAAAEEAAEAALDSALDRARVLYDAIAKKKEEILATAGREDKLNYIRLQNEISVSRGFQYPRVCGCCGVEAPPQRAFFPSCGHAVCIECAHRRTVHVSDENGRQCPPLVCAIESDYIRLFEVIEDSN